MLDRRSLRFFFTAALCCVFSASCGESVSVLTGPDTGAGTRDDGPLVDVSTDARDSAPEDVATDVSDAGDVTVTDVATDASDASDVTVTDATTDAGDDASLDAAGDVMSADVGDAGAMDAPPSDMGPTPDIPSPDVPSPDVTPIDSGPTTIAGHRARSLVSAGSVMTSRSYRMVSTLGQTSLHPSVLQSLNFRLRGGLIGAASGTR